jgi:hypothetical protein
MWWKFGYYRAMRLLLMLMFAVVGFAQNPEITISHFQFSNRALIETLSKNNPALTPGRLAEGEMVTVSTSNPETEAFLITIAFVAHNGDKASQSIGVPNYRNGSSHLFEIGLTKVLGITVVPMRASGSPATI